MMTPTTVELQRTGRALCLSGAALGALGLVGWFFEAEIVTTFIAGRPAMMPNTAVSLLMLGLAAAMPPPLAPAGRIWTVMASVLGVSVLAIAVATVAEYVTGWNLGIDQILMSGAGAATYPGRPSPITAAALTLLATALLVTDRGIRFAQFAEWLTLAAASLPFVSLVGHLLGAGQIYQMRTAPAIGVALPTAIALLLIAVGMLLRNPTSGRMKIATSRGPGGILVRRLGIIAILGPPLLGVIAHRTIALAGFVDLPLTLAALSVVGVPVALSVIFRTARRIDEVHDALEESRQQAQALIEGSADGIFVADLDGRYIDVNPVGCQMLDRPREDIIGRTILDLIPPEEVGRLAEARSRLLEGATQTAEWHLRKKDGTFLPVEVSAKILADGRWQGVARDITRRKAAEEAAHRSEARLEGIISIAADAIISVDERQHIVMYNEGARRIFGWSSAEAIGKPLDMLIPRRFADAHRQHIQGFDRESASAARMMHGRPMVVGVRKNGEEFPAEAAISKIADDKQKLFTVFLRDVTVTKQLEANLRQAVKRFRFVAEAGEILGSSLDFQENMQSLAGLAARSLCDCCLITMSDEEGGLITTRADAPHGMNAGKIDVKRVAGDPDRPPGWLATQRREPMLAAEVNDEWLRSHALEEPTLALVREVGATSLMEVPIVAGDQFVGTMLLLAAESGRTYGEADLHAVQDLARRTGLAAESARLYRVAQAATRARDEMLSIVAHDLRSPLAAAQFGASVLAGQVPEDRREASRKPTEVIQRSIRLATRLVDDLLDVARVEAGKLGLDLREVSPEVIVYSAVESHLPLATGGSVQLEAEVAPGLPLVLADEERIQQVLGNLLNNAIKFTPRGGRVRIAAQQEGDEVRFTLIDTGAGIAPDHLPRIFDRFWQSRSGDRRGAGLGLAIAKGIVEAHGGHIWAESVVGTGSTFSFTLRVFCPQSDPKAEINTRMDASHSPWSPIA